MIELFDSHCHLDIEPLKNNFAGAIERAYKSGVMSMINVGSSLRGSKTSVELANSYPNIWASVGVHPHESETIMDLENLMGQLHELSQNDKVVAIGEIGLDYFNFGEKISSEQKDAQKKLFIAQLKLAGELSLPIIFHVRDAWDDFFEILEKQKSENGHYPSGVVHCFTGNEETARIISNLGIYVGFTGFVTFEQEKFDDIREAVKIIPLDRILIETDAPFLAPEPYRGKTNEPAYVLEIARKIADLRGDSLENIAEATYKNTKKVFNIK